MSVRKSLLVGLAALSGVFTVAATGSPAPEDGSGGNSYYLYTAALRVEDSGVVAVPSRFTWSVETSSSGIDARGQRLPDARIMLRLYDPDQNFTALTAQMDLATAGRLHRELGEIIARKLENPGFEHHPQLYERGLIPTGRFKGIDGEGRAIVELEKPQSWPGE